MSLLWLPTGWIYNFTCAAFYIVSEVVANEVWYNNFTCLIGSYIVNNR